jgi:hypothetical protein
VRSLDDFARAYERSQFGERTGLRTATLVLERGRGVTVVHSASPPDPRVEQVVVRPARRERR